MSALLRWREPLVVVLLAAAVLRLVTVPLRMVFYAPSYESVPLAAANVGALLAQPVLLVALAAAALWCTRGDPTPHARSLLTLALVVAGVTTLAALGLVLLGLMGRGRLRFLAFLETVPMLGLSVLVVAALLVVLRAVSADPRAVDTPARPELPYGAPPIPAPVEPPAHQPTWQPDQASGAVWHTAGDAAAGAPASGWGAGEDTGWQPIPRQPGWAGPPPPVAPRSAPDGPYPRPPAG